MHRERILSCRNRPLGSYKGSFRSCSAIAPTPNAPGRFLGSAKAGFSWWKPRRFHNPGIPCLPTRGTHRVAWNATGFVIAVPKFQLWFSTGRKESYWCHCSLDRWALWTVQPLSKELLDKVCAGLFSAFSLLPECESCSLSELARAPPFALLPAAVRAAGVRSTGDRNPEPASRPPSTATNSTSS